MQLLMSCSIQLNNKQRIVYYQHNGTIEKKNIIEAWGKVLTLLIHQGINYNLILDYRGAYFNFTTFEIDEIVNFFYSKISILNDRKIAGIAIQSHETAIIKLIETLKVKDTDFQIRAFRAMEEACKYLYLE